jgi:integrase/recombinase XerD
MSDKIFADFTAHLQHTDKSPKTVKAYLIDLASFEAWIEGDELKAFDPAQIIPLDVIKYRQHLQQTGRKPSTINRAITALKLFFEWAYENQLATDNPVKPVKLVKQVKEAPRHLSDQEESALIRAVTKHGTPRDKTIIVLMLHTGLRASEAMGLKWEDVTIKEKSGSIVVRAGKGNKYRKVPLNPTARTVLQEWRAASPPDANYIFTSANGEQLGTRGLGYLLDKYTRFADIDKVTPHDLRHRFAYRLAEETKRLDIVQQVLGHESLITTARYTKPTQDDLQDAVNGLAWE